MLFTNLRDEPPVKMKNKLVDGKQTVNTLSYEWHFNYVLISHNDFEAYFENLV